ncbi:DNA-processing protein DprA [Verrucomicrobia bacterium]|nr:DNA-processing protein DprA [Verrucomicrobiota bacterium]
MVEKLSWKPSMTSTEAYIALNMIGKVGPVRLRHLLGYFENPESILKASSDQLLRVEGIGRDTAACLSDWENQVDLVAELNRIQDYGCSVVTQQDPLYPPSLREIYDPPMLLYLRGLLEERDHHGIAMVGSRMTTSYGVESARRLAYQIAQAGVTVVSGGARGIDTAAHLGCLRAGGRTIAVIGSGLDIIYPSENIELFDQIAEQGVVMTQFPFRRKADRQTFPIRNRIVAGMTLGTMVVEANRTSGALITANMAVDYGRQVFALPGRIDSPRSKGCHALIKNGAKLCESAEDILSEFEYLFPPSITPENEANVTPPSIPLSDEETIIWKLLEATETHMDVLIRGSQLSAAKVSVVLMGMEMKRLVKRLPGQMYQRWDR